MTRHTLAVLVENRPGVLARVAGLFARRAFNIHSLAVGPTEHERVSRITVVADVDEQPLEQIVKQLNKLVNVLKIVELEARASVERELMLVKVGADDATRTSVLEIASLFRVRIVDVTPASVTIEATGSEDKLRALLTSLEPYGVSEIVKSGVLSIARGPRSLADHLPAAAERPPVPSDRAQTA